MGFGLIHVTSIDKRACIDRLDMAAAYYLPELGQCLLEVLLGNIGWQDSGRRLRLGSARR